MKIKTGTARPTGQAREPHREEGVTKGAFGWHVVRQVGRERDGSQQLCEPNPTKHANGV